jgi:hypothetical protein
MQELCRCLTCWLNLRWHCINKKWTPKFELKETLTLGGGFIPVVSKAYITKHLKNACNFRLHIMGIIVLVLFLLSITCLLKLRLPCSPAF